MQPFNGGCVMALIVCVAFAFVAVGLINLYWEQEA